MTNANNPIISQYGDQNMAVRRLVCKATKKAYQVFETEEQYNMLSDVQKTYTIVLYHGNCNDGVFAAMYAGLFALAQNRSVVFYQFDYKKESKEIFLNSEVSKSPYMKNGTSVVVVDFCHDMEFYEHLAKLNKITIEIHDHHKKAALDIFGKDCDCKVNNYLLRRIDGSVLDVSIEQDSSGAYMAYKRLRSSKMSIDLGSSFGNSVFSKTSRIIEDIKNRDLWLKVNPEREKAVHILFTKYQNDPVGLMDYIYHCQDLEKDIDKTHAVIQYQDQLCASIAKRASKCMVKLPGKIDPIEAMWVCCPPELTSNTAELIYNKHPELPVFLYSLGVDRAYFGLRSHETGPDVCDIAMCFEGGGHSHASGFSVPIVEFITLLRE